MIISINIIGQIYYNYQYNFRFIVSKEFMQNILYTEQEVEGEKIHI